jgi:hypothetical protein
MEELKKEKLNKLLKWCNDLPNLSIEN